MLAFTRDLVSRSLGGLLGSSPTAPPQQQQQQQQQMEPSRAARLERRRKQQQQQPARRQKKQRRSPAPKQAAPRPRRRAPKRAAAPGSTSRKRGRKRPADDGDANTSDSDQETQQSDHLAAVNDSFSTPKQSRERPLRRGRSRRRREVDDDDDDDDGEQEQQDEEEEEDEDEDDDEDDQEDVKTRSRSIRSTIPKYTVNYVDPEVPMRIILPNARLSAQLSRILEHSQGVRQGAEKVQLQQQFNPSSLVEVDSGSQRRGASSRRTDKARGARPSEYDADSEDEDFVRKTLRSSGSQSKGRARAVTVDDFERMVEIAEHELFVSSMYSYPSFLMDHLTPHDELEKSVGSTSRSNQDVGTDTADGDNTVMPLNRLQKAFDRVVRSKEGAETPTGSATPRITALYPDNFASHLPKHCSEEQVVRRFHEYWTQKHARKGALLRRYQKSHLLTNWDLEDQLHDELLTTRNDLDSMHVFALINTLRCIRDEICKVEEFCTLVRDREKLKQRCVAPHTSVKALR